MSGTGPRRGSLVTPEFRNRIRALVVPVAVFFGRLGLTPNGLTIVGFLGTCVAAAAAATQNWILAGILVLAFGIFDLFDGALARATGTASAFGAFLDSTLDRTGENLVYAGIVFGCAQVGFPLGALLAAIALSTASVVTYARARAEAVGLRGEVGIAPRPERLVVLTVGLIGAGIGGVGAAAAGSVVPTTAGAIWLSLALLIIGVTCTVTIVQRILYVHRQAAPRAD